MTGDPPSQHRPVTLFLNAGQTVTCAGPARARRGAEMQDAGVQVGVGVAVQGDRFVAVDRDDSFFLSWVKEGNALSAEPTLDNLHVLGHHRKAAAR